MLDLIIKDILFNRKQIAIGLCLSAGVLFLLTLDQNISKASMVAIFMVPMLIFNFLVGKSCFMEDKYNVHSFLKTLPLAKKDIVLSRFIECMLTTLFSFIFMYLVNFLISLIKTTYLDFSINELIIIFSILLIYNSLFLYIYFKTNYAIANQTIVFMFIIFVVLYKIKAYIEKVSAIDLNIVFSKIKLPYLLLLVAACVFIFMYKIAVKAFLVKE